MDTEVEVQDAGGLWWFTPKSEKAHEWFRHNLGVMSQAARQGNKVGVPREFSGSVCQELTLEGITWQEVAH